MTTPSDPDSAVSSDSEQFRLLIFHGDSIRTVPLIGDEWVIGRASDCDISLPDQTVSRRHLRLERRGSEFWFRDLGSANPILLNGKAVHQGQLPLNQTLLIGLTRITLDRKITRLRLVTDPEQTQVMSREVLDDERQSRTAPRTIEPDEVARMLEAFEWTLGDLGSPQDVAQPLLNMALNLTQRRRGTLGRFGNPGTFQNLATLDHTDQERDLHLPEPLLREARTAAQPFLVTAHHRGDLIERLVIPLGPGPDGVIVLEDPRQAAPKGQDALRIARAIGTVAWQRLQEVEHRVQLHDELERLRVQGTKAHATVLASTRLQPLRPAIREAATQDSTVLLLGEDGTEREELAHYLHSQSPRNKHAFVPFHPSIVPTHRVEAELFGSGAGQGGALARAQAGTLYVDHPERLPEFVQERLGAAIRDQRLGETPIQVRLVAGSDFASPDAEVRLHPSLASLLGGSRFLIPPLREDPRDVLSLAELILTEMGSLPDGQARVLSEGTKRLLSAYPWPGNVRELRSVIEQAAAIAGAQPIAPRHLPEHVQKGHASNPTTVPTLEEVERQHIAEVLARVDHNRQRAAALLGIAPSTLFEKIKRYNLDPVRGKNGGGRRETR